MTDNKLVPFRIELHEENVKVNPLIDGAVRKKLTEFEGQINNFDGLNKNGIPDVQEIHDLAMEVLPKAMVSVQRLSVLSASINFEEIAKDFADSKYIKDHAVFAAEVGKLGTLLEESGKLLEKANALFLVALPGLSQAKEE